MEPHLLQGIMEIAIEQVIKQVPRPYVLLRLRLAKALVGGGGALHLFAAGPATGEMPSFMRQVDAAGLGATNV